MIYTLLVDDTADGFTPTSQVRAEIDQRINEATRPPASPGEHIHRWATSPEAKAGQDAALALVRRA